MRVLGVVINFKLTMKDHLDHLLSSILMCLFHSCPENAQDPWPAGRGGDLAPSLGVTQKYFADDKNF